MVWSYLWYTWACLHFFAVCQSKWIVESRFIWRSITILACGGDRQQSRQKRLGCSRWGSDLLLLSPWSSVSCHLCLVACGLLAYTDLCWCIVWRDKRLGSRQRRRQQRGIRRSGPLPSANFLNQKCWILFALFNLFEINYI